MKLTKMHASDDVYMGAVQVNEKGEIALPMSVMQMFKIHPGDELQALGDMEQGIALGNAATMKQFRPGGSIDAYRGQVTMENGGLIVLPVAVVDMFGLKCGQELAAFGDANLGIAFRKAGAMTKLGAKAISGHVPPGKWMGVVSVREHGNLTIPRQLIEMFHLKVGEPLIILADRKDGIALEKATQRNIQTDEGKWIGTVTVREDGYIQIPEGLRTMFHIEPGEHLLMLADKLKGIAIGGLDTVEDPDEKGRR